MRYVRRKISFLALLLFFGIGSSRAQWTSDPSKNTPVDTGGHKAADLIMLKDGSGGAFLVWDDQREGFNKPKIFAQHLDHTGHALWAANGVEVSPPGVNQSFPQAAIVGDGSIIISWVDARDSVLGSESAAIFAQRIMPSGTLRWGSGGLPIAEPNYLQLFYPTGTLTAIAPDGKGGAYIAWSDLLSGFQNLMVTRIDSSGNTDWALPALSGSAMLISRSILVGGYDQLRLMQNGTTGVIAMWTDVRYAFTTGVDLFAQRLDSAGAVKWDSAGVALSPKGSYLQSQKHAQLVSDGSGGAIYAWEQSYSGSSPKAYAGHISSSGSLTWITPTDSVGIRLDSVASAGQEKISMTSEGSGTAILTWTDGANYTYAQKLASDGSLPWGAFPAAIASNGTGEVLTTDGSGGVILAWGRGLQNGVNIFAQHVNSTGQLLWSNPTYGTSGNPVSTTPSTFQSSPVIVSDDAGGAIVAWYDLRASSFGGPYDIYVQHVQANGSVTNVAQQAAGIPSHFELLQNYPNPFNPTTTIQFSISEPSNINLKVFDLLGREMTTLVNGRMEAGAHHVSFDASRLASGIYFYQLQAGTFLASKKLILLK
jgi:hypothetical protein